MKLLLVFLVLFYTSATFAANITVGKGKQYTSIRQAIAAAVDGDVLVIHEGTYAEGEITLTKKLHLKGAGKVVIDGQNKHQVLSISANNVTIEGLTIINGGYSSMYDFAAIKLIDCSNAIIRNNVLINTTFGIYLQNTKNCRISSNRVEAKQVNEIHSGNAIHCWKSDKVVVEKNVVTGHRDGIYFEFVTSSTISHNKSFGNLRYGLHFMFSHNNGYFYNSFTNNGSGVAVMYTRGVTMVGNLFHDNWGSAAYGVLMKDISDSKVENNSFINNTVGIFMEGSSRINIRNNSFSSNGWAMRVQSSCNDNTIEKNNFIANSFDIGSNGDMQLNNFDGNYWDKYEGYDLNRDKVGDVPYRPVSMFSMVAERNPSALMLFRSFLVDILDKSEKVVPALIPEALTDNKPAMKKIAIKGPAFKP